MEGTQSCSMEFINLIAPVKKLEKKNKDISKLKNTPNLNFLTNQSLVLRYGLMRDSDGDGFLNYRDCYPFDKNRDGLKSIVRKVKMKIAAIKGASSSGSTSSSGTYTAGSGSSANLNFSSGSTYNPAPSSSTPTSSSGGGIKVTVTSPTKTSSGGGGGGGSAGVSSISPSKVITSTSGQVTGINTGSQSIPITSNVPTSQIQQLSQAQKVALARQQSPNVLYSSGEKIDLTRNRKNTFIIPNRVEQYKPTIPKRETYYEYKSPEQISLEKEMQEKGDIYGKAIYEVPAQMSGEIFTKQLTKEEKGKIDTLGKFFNPKKQFEVYKSEAEYKQALNKAVEIDKKLQNLNEQYSQGKISDSEYSLKWDFYSTNKDYQKVLSEQETRKNIYQDISSSGLSPTKKFVTKAIVGAADFGSFVSPVSRVSRGSKYFVEGTEQYGKAQTTGEKVESGVGIVVGGLLMKSGAGGKAATLGGKNYAGRAINRLAKAESKYGISGGIGERLIGFGSSRTGRVAIGLSRETLPLGISGLYGAGIYQQTGEVSSGVAAGLGAYAGLRTPMAIERFVKDKPLTTKEVEKLESELKNLEKAEALDTTFISKGKGTKEGADRVDMISIQETPNFRRVIRVEGDLIKNEKGTFFFPEGKGKSSTEGKFKVDKGKEQLFTNVQSFEVGAKGKGINLGSKGNVLIGSSVGTTTFVPKVSVSQVIRNPRNIFENIRENLRLKVKPKVKEFGGDVIKEVDTDVSAKSLSYEPENIPGFSRIGVSKTPGRKGTFFELKEEPPEIFRGLSPSPSVKKTPISKTFGIEEPVNKPGDLITPRRTPNVVEQKKAPRQTPQEVLDTSFISKNLQKRVTEGELKTSQRLAQEIKLKGNIRTRNLSNIRIDLLQGTRAANLTKPTNLLAPTFIDTKQDIQQDIITITPPINRLTPEPIEKITPTFFPGEPTPPRIPKQPDPFRIFSTPEPPKKPVYDKQKGFDIYVQVPENNGKYQRVNQQPLSQETALDRLSERVDRFRNIVGRIATSKSRVTKRLPSGQKVNVVVNNPTGYYEANKYKFTVKNGILKEKKRYETDSVFERQNNPLFNSGRNKATFRL